MQQLTRKELMIKYFTTALMLLLLPFTHSAQTQDAVDALVKSFMYEPKYLLLSKINASPDDDPDTTEKHLRFLKELTSSTGTVSGFANKNFPSSYYSDGVKRVFSSTDSLTYLGGKDVSTQQLTLFGSQISAQLYYRLNGRQTRYTVFSLDKEGNVIFVDFPDSY